MEWKFCKVAIIIHQQDVEPIPVIKILAYLFEISMILKVSSSEICVASQAGEYKCLFREPAWYIVSHFQDALIFNLITIVPETLFPVM